MNSSCCSIAMPCCHERREHFDLQRRYFRQEANAIGDAALVRPENVEHIAHQIERAFLNAVATEDNLLRADPVGDGESGLLVAKRSAGEAQDVSIPVMEAMASLPRLVPEFEYPAFQAFRVSADSPKGARDACEASRRAAYASGSNAGCFLASGAWGR
jgi:hypothetical protein